uniref:Transcription elongation factor 1 homolog n=1 Tax=Elaeis guineensis var. tenera TaxID=51953 RepID=A0A6I9QWL3_ELAGV|nr:transcription elongation factor 1 homolog isoform X2 [Elaeis guineensis]XP_019707111.1 transcription elongation factor 1 homolog isoform X2 [Elaeis guineensis]
MKGLVNSFTGFNSDPSPKNEDFSGTCSSCIHTSSMINSSMGKRKSRAKPPPKKRMDKLDTVFCCPFCNHGSSIECCIDMKNLIGEAACRICQESFSTTITALTEPIDIYSEWIDECERVNNLEDDAT